MSRIFVFIDSFTHKLLLRAEPCLELSFLQTVLHIPNNAFDF